MEELTGSTIGWAALGVAVIVVVFVAANLAVQRYSARHPEYQVRRQVTRFVLGLAALVALLVVLPIGDSRRGQLLSLLGILLSAAIALSSTTLLGNAMAGLMLRTIKPFRPGDFIRVGDGYFGKVSEVDLFHTEVQTEERNLITFSNLHLITNPVTVIQRSGTFLSVEVTLGYDVPRGRVRELLLDAAARTELTDAYVQVVDLGDFSVRYRVAGLLSDLDRNSLIATRSRLREMTLDALHEGGVEIVSPNFMNTRALEAGIPVMPAPEPAPAEASEAAPEAAMFDKAEEAASIDQDRVAHDALLKEIASLEESLDAAPEAHREEIGRRIDAARTRADTLAAAIQERTASLKAAKED